MSIGGVLNLLCWVMIILIFIRVAFSWISRDFSNPVYQFSYRFTEPLLRPVRDRLPGGGGLDFSPMIVSFGLMIVAQLVSNL
jgi:YggT family protein